MFRPNYWKCVYRILLLERSDPSFILAQLFCRINPSIKTSTKAVALVHKDVMKNSKICGPKSADERLSSVTDGRARDLAGIETANKQRAESPLSVGLLNLGFE